MNNIKKILLLFGILITNIFAQNNNIGFWFNDTYGLPTFEYTGTIPYSAQMPNGEKVKLPSDPWFLLGNYRFKLFTHVSGNYQLITGEREWARLNLGGLPNTGFNKATLKILGEPGKEYELTGITSVASNPKKCKRVFGCGYAEYKYQLDGLECVRNLSVKPSTNPYNGTSAFVITVTIKNKNTDEIDLIYNESITANYVPMKQQKLKADDRIIKYRSTVKKYSEQNLIVVKNIAKAEDPFLFPTNPETISQFDGFPPSLFLKIVDGNVQGEVFSQKNNTNNMLDEIFARFSVKLKPSEEKSFQIVIGFIFNSEVEHINQLVKELQTNISGSNKFVNEWLKIIPTFPNEKDEVLKREMTWNAYNLEAMATYSQYYNETKIPQGTNYAYDLGIHASARDNFQHALPIPHFNPALAKSILRYMMKRTAPDGRIKLIEWGFGYADSWYFYTSDQQLFSFMYFAEYLRVTKDYDILNETANFFPYKNMPEASMLDWIEVQFRFLRDQVSVGKHGLVRLLNSDWNDFVYHVVKEPYNNVLYTGESHMNSAMAISILDDFIPQLEEAKLVMLTKEFTERLEKLIASMKLYKSKIEKAFMKDLGDRKFPRRLYFNGKAYGDDNMFLEPQGYTLQINSLNVGKKEELYKEMKERVYKGEKIAARQQQVPEFESEDYEKGSRENGGVWWALNGPVILGVAEFNKQEAWKLLKKMTRENFVKQFPEYWSSYWSQTDNFESSLMPGEGLPDQTWHLSDIPVYCAHSHAWPLYCYYRLTEE
jgi:cellobiose phosphorylase